MPGYGYEGFFAILVGQNVPHRARYVPTADERMLFAKFQAAMTARASKSIDSRKLLEIIRRPGWSWKQRAPMRKMDASMVPLFESPLALAK